MERLATLSSEAQCTAIQIEEISADKSGRSFLIKTTDSVVSYFWYSEKSKLLGNELLGKIKDLLMRKPSLAELSGISEARLNCFATHLRAYLAGSMVVSAHAGGVLSASPPSDDSVDSSELHLPQYSQQCSSQGSKTNLIYQGKIFPRSNSFKEGLPISLSSVRTADTEKLKRCRENYASCIDSLSLASTNSSDPSNSNCFGKNKLTEANGVHPFATMNFVDPFGKSAELPLSGPKILVPSSGPSHFSPQYCWCPPVASTLQYRLGNSKLPTSSTESLSLPPLASLLSAARPSSLLTSEPSLNLSEVPPVNFPSLLPEPLVRFPTLHQFPTFTPLICGPIVHIPVIEVGSSGPGYLVSAGPAMHTTLPPLNPNLVDSVLPNAESMVEKSARETLRMLISSSNQPKQQLLSSSNQPKPQLLDVLPSVLSSNNDKQNVIATASRGLYGGTRDEDVISSSMTSMGLVLLSEKPLEGCVGKICASRDDSIDKKQKPSTSGSTGFDSGMNWF